MSLLRASLTLLAVCAALAPLAIACDEQRIRTLLVNPPQGWEVNQLTARDVNDFICSETLVTAVVDCLENPEACDHEVEGLGVLVDEIYSRIDEGNNCVSCDPEVMSLLVDSVKTVQKRFPRQYIRGLSYF